MLGYLNADSPFTEDGWLRTGDAVEVDGEYFRILGRRSEMINVGGEKVYPAEVESVLQQMDGVEDALVFGEANALTGQMVVARVLLDTDEKPSAFRIRMRSLCRQRLVPFKIPQKVKVVEESLHGGRFKKLRGGEARAARTAASDESAVAAQQPSVEDGHPEVDQPGPEERTR